MSSFFDQYLVAVNASVAVVDAWYFDQKNSQAVASMQVISQIEKSMNETYDIVMAHFNKQMIVTIEEEEEEDETFDDVVEFLSEVYNQVCNLKPYVYDPEYEYQEYLKTPEAQERQKEHEKEMAKIRALTEQERNEKLRIREETNQIREETKQIREETNQIREENKRMREELARREQEDLNIKEEEEEDLSMYCCGSYAKWLDYIGADEELVENAKRGERCSDNDDDIDDSIDIDLKDICGMPYIDWLISIGAHQFELEHERSNQQYKTSKLQKQNLFNARKDRVIRHLKHQVAMEQKTIEILKQEIKTLTTVNNGNVAIIGLLRRELNI